MFGVRYIGFVCFFSCLKWYGVLLRAMLSICYQLNGSDFDTKSTHKSKKTHDKKSAHEQAARQPVHANSFPANRLVWPYLSSYHEPWAMFKGFYVKSQKPITTIKKQGNASSVVMIAFAQALCSCLFRSHSQFCHTVYCSFSFIRSHSTSAKLVYGKPFIKICWGLCERILC